LILVSRSRSKLQELESELIAGYPSIKARVLDVDLGVAPLDPRLPALLREVSKEGDIRVLINNAGVGHSIPVTFAETTPEEMETIVAVNVAGLVRITKATLPYFLEEK
jgi:17beta-estradiol 17-dehydrogenase / very-long-chain 3-oxoacyl-CoA reductase